MPPYVYVVVRIDMSLADQICQVAHACIEAGKEFQHNDNTNLVLLAVADRVELGMLARKLELKDIEFKLFYEPDDDMRHTALATRTVHGEERQLFRQYDLWRPPNEGTAPEQPSATRLPEQLPLAIPSCSKCMPEKEAAIVVSLCSIWWQRILNTLRDWVFKLKYLMRRIAASLLS